MSDTDEGSSEEAGDAPDTEGEHAAKRTGDTHACRRCNRKQGLVGKYDIWLCRQCFREMARDMGFNKYS